VRAGALSLGRQLRRAAAAAVSDAFLDTATALVALEAAAGSSRVQGEVAARSDEFTLHAARLTEAAEVACSVSARADGVRMARQASRQLGDLGPQVS
jgi:hypothetical protein